MGSFRLKTSIGLHLMVFIFLAGISIDFVSNFLMQQNFLNAKVVEAHNFLKNIEDHLVWDETGKLDVSGQFLSRFHQIAPIMAWDGLGVTNGYQGNLSWGSVNPSDKTRILEIAQRSYRRHEALKVFQGEAWGVFWKQHRNLFVAIPLELEGRVVGGACLAFDLGSFYRQWRHEQKILFLYIIGNCVLLTFIGVSRFSNLIFKPLHKLVHLANEFRPGNEALYFLKAPSKNEFGKLSTALNQMLSRISKDQEKLKKTVQRLKRANLEIHAAQSRVVQAEKLASVGRLAAGVAHEIGNPIGIVLGYLGLLRDGSIPQEERLDFLERAEKEIQRVNIIIRQLLDHSRTNPSGLKPVSLHDLIREIVSLFNVQPLTSNLKIACQLEALNDTICADVEQVRQVFVNLVMNSADAILMSEFPGTGKIDICSSLAPPFPQVGKRNSNWISIQISDNGPGIAEENLQKIFDPFFTTKEPGKGTGLGLAISYQIVKNLGGEIRVESTVGKGTCFDLLLPLAKEKQNPTLLDFSEQAQN